MKFFPIRFSLATLMGVVGAVAFMCAALRSVSEFWASAAFTLCLGLLLFSVLAALLQRDAGRAFWIGFLVFCCGYFVIAFGPWFSDNVRDHLLTAKLLRYVHTRFTPASSNAVRVATGLVDIDNNGAIDLYVGNQLQPNRLSASAVNGDFIVLSGQVASGDFDGDGRPDIIVGNSLPSGPTWENFQRTGHSLLAVIVGFVGGLLALVLWRSRKPSAPNA